MALAMCCDLLITISLMRLLLAKQMTLLERTHNIFIFQEGGRKALRSKRIISES